MSLSNVNLKKQFGDFFFFNRKEYTLEDGKVNQQVNGITV